jgi:hypothetical protein
MVKEFPALCVTHTLVTLFTRVFPWNLYSARSIQSTLSYHICYNVVIYLWYEDDFLGMLAF